jgi:hypothetical protein
MEEDDKFSNPEMRTINGIGTTLYGHAKKIELTGQEQFAAVAAGFLPVSYQAVKWYVVFLLPFVPLGTYRVMKMPQSFWSVGPSYYKMVRVRWDWSQVFLHYLVGYGLLIFTVACIVGGLIAAFG